MIKSTAGGVLVLALMTLMACAPTTSPEEHTSSSTSALTNGVRDESDDGVVALALDDGSVFCTGTLIAPRFVLTAAHCLGYDPSHVLFAKSRSGVKKLTQHPDFDASTLAHDIGIIELDAAASVTPLSYGELPTPVKETSVRLVGFGRAKAADMLSAGKKQKGEAKIKDVIPAKNLLELAPSPAMACSGDSGGPVFSNDQLIGVVSFGDEACKEVTFATSVSSSSSEQSFIDGVVNAPPPVAAPTPEPAAAGCSASGRTSAPSSFVLLAALVWLVSSRSAGRSEKRPSRRHSR